MLLTRKDVGSHIATAGEVALDPAAITAGAGNDGSAVNGNTINRLLAGRGLAMSAKLVISFVTSLTATKKLTITAKVQHDSVSNLATVADYTTGGLRARFFNSGTPSASVWTPITLSSGSVPATDVATATGTNRGVLEFDIDLSGAKQYIRAVVTADLSNSATDTVVIAGNLILGGFDVEPAA